MEVFMSDMLGNLICLFKEDKSNLIKMIDKLGKNEAAMRLSWLFSQTKESMEMLIDQWLTGEYYDDKDVKGGNFFWGEL